MNNFTHLDKPLPIFLSSYYSYPLPSGYHGTLDLPLAYPWWYPRPTLGVPLNRTLIINGFNEK